MPEPTVRYMAKCLTCATPRTPWTFQTYDKRAEWVGKHRVTTGHKVHQWLEAK